MPAPSSRHAHQQPTWTRATAPQVPNGAAGLYLLGRIARATGRDQQAAAWLAKALQLDPMAWGAYDQLCALGAGQG
jgi:cytochrome c-type biogenesis protein CcmH/NrfG